MNLIAACDLCNGGKGNRRLSDSAVVEKQQNQLQVLAIRREQLEMVLAWRRQLEDIAGLEVEAIAAEVVKASNMGVNEHGHSEIRTWLRKFQLSQILDAVTKSFQQYFRGTNESWEKAFAYIPRICNFEKKYGEPSEELKRLFYCRAILRNRFNGYYDAHKVLTILCGYYESGLSLNEIEHVCRDVNNWTKLNNRLAEALRQTDNAGEKP